MMIDKRPFWKRPLGLTLMVLVAAGLGAWLALDRPLPAGWFDEAGPPQMDMPSLFRGSEPERIFCAESVDTGLCSCISSTGERPAISESECRRRARNSETAATEDRD